MARRWNPTLHPRDRKGRFTRSGTRPLTIGDSDLASQIAGALAPKRGVTGPRAKTYLQGIAGDRSDDHAAAVGRYFDGGFVDTNRAARAGKVDDPEIRALDAAMQPLPDDLIVSRRVPAEMFGDVPLEDLKGMKVRDAAYFPAALGTVPGKADDVRMHVAVPKGTRAVVHPDMGELLLDRDLELAVARVERNGQGGTDMHLVALPKVGAEDDDPGAGLGGDSDSGQAGGGDTASTGDRPEWQPALTRADAERFVADSRITVPLYHGTTDEAATAIRADGFDPNRAGAGGTNVYGAGLYLTADQTAATNYAQARGGTMLETRARLLNPADGDSEVVARAQVAQELYGPVLTARRLGIDVDDLLDALQPMVNEPLPESIRERFGVPEGTTKGEFVGLDKAGLLRVVDRHRDKQGSGAWVTTGFLQEHGHDGVYVGKLDAPDEVVVFDARSLVVVTNDSSSLEARP